MIKSKDCKSKGYQRDRLNQLVINEICKLSADPDRISKLQNKSTSTNKDNTVVLKNRLSDIDKQIGKLLDLYQLGSIDISKISVRIEELNKEKDNLTKELEEQKMPLPQLSVEETLNILSSAESVFQNGTPEEQQALVRSLIKKIILNGDSMEIHWFFCVESVT